MIRSILAISAGTTLWGGLWVAANGVVVNVFDDAVNGDGSLTHVPALLTLLMISVALSLLAGYVTAWIGQKREFQRTLMLGMVQLAIGIIVQWQSLDLMPLWYHIPFLLLLIPGNVAGGYLLVWLRERNRSRMPHTG